MRKPKNLEVQRMAMLMACCETLARATNVIDVLPNRMPDDTPLRDALPGIWPTVGDARAIRDEMVRLGWKPQ